MIAPSSSHTAGAVRIGLMAGQLKSISMTQKTVEELVRGDAPRLE